MLESSNFFQDIHVDSTCCFTDKKHVSCGSEPCRIHFFDLRDLGDPDELEQKRECLGQWIHWIHLVVLDSPRKGRYLAECDPWFSEISDHFSEKVELNKPFIFFPCPTEVSTTTPQELPCWLGRTASPGRVLVLEKVVLHMWLCDFSAWIWYPKGWKFANYWTELVMYEAWCLLADFPLKTKVDSTQELARSMRVCSDRVWASFVGSLWQAKKWYSNKKY